MSNELSHLTGEQAWAFANLAANDDQARVKAIRALPMEARHELAGLGMHGRKDDSPGFRTCVEFYSDAGLPPSYRPVDIQKGLEKLGVTAPSGAGAQWVADNIKDCELKVYDNIGHADLVEVPDETIATTIDFLQRAEKKVLG